MGYELIISEKPSAAKKIAAALADKAPNRIGDSGVYGYELTHKGKLIKVASAVGHLYTVTEKEKNAWKYPSYDIEWKASYETNKASSYTKKYLQFLKKLAKDADSYTVATDYDIEGEVIGLNIIRYICKQKDANRMKFSTLTKPDLIKSYEAKQKHLDWGQANAGETRHFLDWLYGINISRAMTTSIKNATNGFKVMSSGRVQGPALKIVVDRELEIQAFKPTPFWQIELKANKSRHVLTAMHKEDKIWDKARADEIMVKTKGYDANVSEIKTTEINQAQPTPFDLTTLQTEAYRVFKITPKNTLAIAQELYTSGVMSYPRTSSQQLPPEIGYKKIMAQLAQQSNYTKLINDLLAMPKLEPRNGKKTDPAHPAIYPTGIPPKDLKPHEQKIYDLIVKRFMATFSDPAIRQTVTANFDVNSEIFICKGTKTKVPGWHVFYAPYVKLEEIELPALEKGETLKTKSIKELEKETQPPRRYTEASIIKELEKRGLGTKATRAAIVDTLFQRGYVQDKALKATILGIKLIDVLKKYIPDIISEELTKDFEVKMEGIRQSENTPDQVLTKAKDILDNVLLNVKNKEKLVGQELAEANLDMKIKDSTLGPCPSCEDGELVIKRGKFGRFVACNKYPDCKVTLKIPQSGQIKAADKVCEECKHPMVKVVNKGKRPQELCLNPDCKTKLNLDGLSEEAKLIVQGKKEKTCPKCGKAKLILRNSIYGRFLGCSNYPKCKYMEPLVQPKIVSNNKDDSEKIPEKEE